LRVNLGLDLTSSSFSAAFFFSRSRFCCFSIVGGGSGDDTGA
jgi:hypothetical protein